MKLKGNNGWISVKDSLPEDDKLKLVRYKNTDYNRHSGLKLSRYYLPSNQTDTKFWCFEFNNTQPLKITHWMQIPGPPEGGL